MEMFMYKHSKRGFTLVELMAVITIMGILATVVVPNMFGVIERSREKIDLLKLFYLRDALDRALVENELALTNSPLITGQSSQATKDTLTKQLYDKLKSEYGVSLFVMELKGGVSINVQGKHGSANDAYNMGSNLIGNSGTWYEALKEARFEGVAEVVAFRYQTTDENGIKKYLNEHNNDLSGEKFSVTPDGKYYRTYPNNQMFTSRALNQGKTTSANYRLTMNFQWSGGKESSRSVEVALLPNGCKMRNSKGRGGAYKTDHGVCFSTYGDAGCKNYSYTKCSDN